MKEQAGIDIVSKFASRLAEERKRLHPHQGDFAEKIGITQGRQSLYERGERDLKADYLETVAGVGLDVAYIVTGRRSADSLDEQSSAVVQAFGNLAANQRTTLAAFLESLSTRVSTD